MLTFIKQRFESGQKKKENGTMFMIAKALRLISIILGFRIIGFVDVDKIFFRNWSYDDDSNNSKNWNVNDRW